MSSFESFDAARMSLQAVPHLWAYLDPGMGSMVLQVLVAGLLSSSFFLKTWFRQVRETVWARTRKS